MTDARKFFLTFAMILLFAVAVFFAAAFYLEPSAAAVSAVVEENDFFDILKPEGMEDRKQFATSEDKDYLSGEPLLFRLRPKAGRDISELTYRDGDAGEILTAEKNGGYFPIKLRYNEVYTFYFTDGNERKTVEVDLSNRMIFDLTAPEVDFTKTKFTYTSGGTDINVFISDDVSSRRHITAKSGIKRVKITAKNRVEPIYERDDYPEGTGTGGNACYVAIKSATYAMGDVYAEIEDHAGHTVNVAVAVWSDTVKSDARDMLARADAVLKKEVGGVGLNDRLVSRLNTLMERLNACLNDENATSLQIREAKNALGTVKEEAENAFRTESGKAYQSIDETLVLRVSGEQYLYGGSVYLSNRKTTDYFAAAKFGDEVIVTLVIKQGAASVYEETEGLIPPDSFDAYILYDIKLTVNGEEKTAETPFNITVSKTEEFVSPILYSPSGGSYAVSDFQSSDGWIRFEVAENGVYTVFLKKPFVFPWWAYLLIGIAAAAVIAVSAVLIARKVKKTDKPRKN